MLQKFTKSLFLFFVLTAYTLSCHSLEAQSSNVLIGSPIQAMTSQKKANICLTMIVKNESHIIERCLDSVKDIVDCISISDTGSTDNTVEIIEQYLQKNNIPGKVHQNTWKNFGYNRTLSVESAQKMLEELGFPLAHTFLLLLDADMMLVVEPEFSKTALMHDHYLMIQKSTVHTYHNTRLVRASLPWKCVGVTHEYWTSDKPHHTQQLKTLWIDDRNDGGSKADKFERDIRLLTQGLKDEPDNHRYMFYLGQSYKCLGQNDNAIKWYKERISKGGWKEEVWYSKLMIGESYEDMGFWDQALHWYLDAYQHNPERAESLQKIATHYRSQGQNDLAYLFAKHGSRIPFPNNQLLFITHPVYNYQFLEELSIAAYYTPFKDEGFTAANRLALMKDIPDHVKEQTYQNLLFYAQNIKGRVLPINIELPFIREGMTERYNPMNPSIQKTDNGFKLICRTVNWSQKGGKDYKSRDPSDPKIRTKNFLIEYDRNFKLLSQKEITENLPRNRLPSQIDGLEDCRLFSLNKTDYLLGTTFDTHPGTVGQSLCKLTSGSTGNEVKVEKFVPLKGPNPNRCEKNWLPFAKGDEFYAIYSCDPFILYKPNMETGECETAVEYEPKQDFSRFRGSAAPIEFDDGYLFLVHEVIFKDQRFYVHRLVYLDKDFIIKKVTKPFTFLHKGIEYSCGMAMDHSGKNCVISIGLEDEKANLLIVEANTIRSMLEELP